MADNQNKQNDQDKQGQDQGKAKRAEAPVQPSKKKTEKPSGATRPGQTKNPEQDA